LAGISGGGWGVVVSTTEGSVGDFALDFKVYRKSAQLSFRFGGMILGKGGSKRGEIKKFSMKSYRRLKLVSECTAHLWKAYIVLTYPKEFPADGAVVKRHADTFTKRLRRRGLLYEWTLEFQERGAPHINVLVDGFLPKDELSRMWYEIVGSGDPKHLTNGTSVKGVYSVGQVMSYISKYIGKQSQKEVPEGFTNVGRFWGVSRGIVTYEEYDIPVESRNTMIRCTRIIRRWYKARLRQWGIKWKWKGRGFIMWGGADFIRQILGKEAIGCGKE
jgi:hypothetical protein